MNRHIEYVMYRSDKLIHTNIEASVDYGRLVLWQKLNYITYIYAHFLHMLYILVVWTCLVGKGWLLMSKFKFKLYIFWEKLTF